MKPQHGHNNEVALLLIFHGWDLNIISGLFTRVTMVRLQCKVVMKIERISTTFHTLITDKITSIAQQLC